MSAEERDIQALSSSSGQVPDGVLCISCGYDLRGLSVAVQCPECGTAIRRSLAGDCLGAADPHWLRLMTRGQKLLAWGWLTILMIPAAFILWPIASIFAIEALERFFMTGFTTTAALVGLAGLLLCAVGVVLVTMQDPRESLQEATSSPRRLARAGLIGAFFAHLVGWTIDLLSTTFAEIGRPLFILLFLGLLTVGIVSYLRWLATLLHRVPKHEHATQAGSLASFLRWALPLTVILLWMVPRSRPGRPRPDLPWLLDIIVGLLGCAGAILWILLIVKSVSLAILLFHASATFARCLKQAIVEDEAQKEGAA